MSLGKLTLIVCSCVFFVVFVGLMMALLHNLNAGNVKDARYIALAILWGVPVAAFATFDQVRSAVLDVEENELKQVAILGVWSAVVYVIGFVIFRP